MPEITRMPRKNDVDGLSLTRDGQMDPITWLICMTVLLVCASQAGTRGCGLTQTSVSSRREENGRKMGEKWGQNTHFLQSHFPHFSKGRRSSPTVAFVKLSSPTSPTEQWEFLPLTDTHCHGG